METKHLFLFLSVCLLQAFFPFAAVAEDYPTVKPTMVIVTQDGEEETTAYDGSAPVKASFHANTEDLGDYTAVYEWQFVNVAKLDTFLVRRDADTEYEFRESGSFTVRLVVTFMNGQDTFDQECDPFTIEIPESKLQVPNAFTPNGDGFNDIFKVKEDHQSIVSFEAAVFSRDGKKLYSWRDLNGGWDGTFNGRDVPDGAYYLYVKARGADGRNYNIKKTINLLRGYSESGGSGSGATP